MDKLPLPKEFLPTPGEPCLPFKIWITLFENFIFMRDAPKPEVAKMKDEEKNRLLFTLLGLEGVRIFSAQPTASAIATTPHVVFKQAAMDIFQTPVNPFRAYFDFEQRNQASSESTQEFITALRSLMADCEFDGKETRHLAVRLVCGCHNKDTQKKLLALPKVDLDEVVRIMQADETANQSVAAMGGNSDVHKLRRKPPPSKSPPTKLSQQKPHAKNPSTCTHCGRS